MGTPAKLDLMEFLHTGEFAGIAFGMSGDDVVGVLGEPDDVGAVATKRKARRGPAKSGRFKAQKAVAGLPDKDQARIWRYGDFELHFALPASSLWLIYSDHFQGLPKGGARIEVLDSAIKGQTSLAELDPLFRAERLPYEHVHQDIKDATRIAFDSGVQLAFVEEQEEAGPPPGLHSISYAIAEFL